jgi:hypothetical protein
MHRMVNSQSFISQTQNQTKCIQEVEKLGFQPYRNSFQEKAQEARIPMLEYL